MDFSQYMVEFSSVSIIFLIIISRLLVVRLIGNGPLPPEPPIFLRLHLFEMTMTANVHTASLWNIEKREDDVNPFLILIAYFAAFINIKLL
jgi:hypothetical protein